MASFENSDELDLGNGKRLSVIGLQFIKQNNPVSWVKKMYTLDFSNFITTINNSLTYNNLNGLLTSTVNGITSTTTISDATISNRGLVNTTTQSFSGNKTFTGNVNIDGNTVIGNSSTDRLNIPSQITGATPLVFQGATDNSFTQSISLIDPVASGVSTFRNVTAQVSHTAHISSFSMVVGTNTVTHNLNLTTPNAVIVQAFDTTTNQQVILNMSAATADTFQFTSSIAGTIRITCIG